MCRNKAETKSKNLFIAFPVRALAGLFFFLFALHVAAPVRAAGGAETVEALVAYAVEHNPRLHAARKEWLRVIQKYPQATALDDPMLSYTYPVEPIETRLGPQEHIVSLSQRFPFPGKLGKRGEIAVKEAEVARLEYEKKLRELVYEVKKSCYELFYLNNAVDLAREQLDVFDFFIKAEMSDYAVGTKGLNDVVDAQTRYAAISKDLVIFEELKSAERTRLNMLLDRASEEPVEVAVEPDEKKPDYGLDDLYALALGNESIEIADKRLEQSTLEEGLARYKYLPDFSLGVNYSAIGRQEMSVRDGGRDAASVTFGINIPIWFGKNRAAGEQARLKREKSIEEKASARNEVLYRIKKAYSEASTGGKLVELYSATLIPKAEELIDIARIKYRNGEHGIAGVYLLNRSKPRTTEQAAVTATAHKEKKILYWRTPMDPNFISDKPGKSPMGMDLIPVYEGGEEAMEPGMVRIDPVTAQNIGVRTAPVERMELARDVRTVGRGVYDEKKINHVNTKIEGWVERLNVDFTGQ